LGSGHLRQRIKSEHRIHEIPKDHARCFRLVTQEHTLYRSMSFQRIPRISSVISVATFSRLTPTGLCWEKKRHPAEKRTTEDCRKDRFSHDPFLGSRLSIVVNLCASNVIRIRGTRLFPSTILRPTICCLEHPAPRHLSLIRKAVPLSPDASADSSLGRRAGLIAPV
jgi:hypothetical protein